MNLSKQKQRILDEKLILLREYNQGKGPKPNFSTEELREVRRYQAWKLENRAIFSTTKPKT